MPPPTDRPWCKVRGCDRRTYARGLCSAHYQRARHSRPMEPPIRVGGPSGRCAVEGCYRWAVRRAWCEGHYRRWLRDGDPGLLLREREIQPGHIRKTGAGYREVFVVDHPNAVKRNGRKGGWILQHRLVMAESLGRPLLPDEVVHHRNGDKADNRISNLELWSRAHPNSQRVDDLVAWARELLDLYA